MSVNDTIEAQIQRCEDTIDALQSTAKLGDSLRRLMDNPDFKDVIIEDYFKNEPVRLVHMKADPSIYEENTRLEVEEQMLGIAYTKRHLTVLHQMSDRAVQDIADNRLMIQELRQLQVENANDGYSDEAVSDDYNSVIGE